MKKSPIKRLYAALVGSRTQRKYWAEAFKAIGVAAAIGGGAMVAKGGIVEGGASVLLGVIIVAMGAKLLRHSKED